VAHSPADGALVAGVAGLVALRGGAGQRGVPVHAEGVVLAALLAPSTRSAAEQISAGYGYGCGCGCGYAREWSSQCREQKARLACQTKIFHKIRLMDRMCGGSYVFTLSKNIWRQFEII